METFTPSVLPSCHRKVLILAVFRKEDTHPREEVIVHEDSASWQVVVVRERG